jgi:hypothetical protein
MGYYIRDFIMGVYYGSDVIPYGMYDIGMKGGDSREFPTV